jgi:hypothetical protein
MLKGFHYSDTQEEEVLPLRPIYSNNNGISLATVLRSISDDKSLSILRTIADVSSNGEISIKKLGLSNKQYYSRISALMETRLIKRQSGRYCLTPFGKIIYCCTMIAKNALNNYLNLKAVESAEGSDFSDEEITKLVDALIESREVKEFLRKKC